MVAYQRLGVYVTGFWFRTCCVRGLIWMSPTVTKSQEYERLWLWGMLQCCLDIHFFGYTAVKKLSKTLNHSFQRPFKNSLCSKACCAIDDRWMGTIQRLRHKNQESILYLASCLSLWLCPLAQVHRSSGGSCLALKQPARCTVWRWQLQIARFSYRTVQVTSHELQTFTVKTFQVAL